MVPAPRVARRPYSGGRSRPVTVTGEVPGREGHCIQLKSEYRLFSLLAMTMERKSRIGLRRSTGKVYVSASTGARHSAPEGHPNAQQRPVIKMELGYEVNRNYL